MVQNRDNIKLSIVSLLLNKEMHLRAVAKELKESHSTVMRKLNLLLKQNIVDFKVEGKNKKFFLKKNLYSRSFIFQSELDKQIKLFNRYSKLSIVFQEIINTTDAMVILFGSYAKGLATAKSDIDVYVDCNKKMKKKIESINSRLSVKIGTFDPNSNLAKEIIKNHVIIQGVEEFYAKQQFFGKVDNKGKFI